MRSIAAEANISYEDLLFSLQILTMLSLSNIIIEQPNSLGLCVTLFLFLLFFLSIFFFYYYYYYTSSSTTTTTSRLQSFLFWNFLEVFFIILIILLRAFSFRTCSSEALLSIQGCQIHCQSEYKSTSFTETWY